MISKSITYLIDEDSIVDLRGNDSIFHSSLCIDSRKTKKGSLFVAIKGTVTDGHRYIDQAIERGATGIVCETLPEKLKKKATYVQVKDSQRVLGKIASRFYDDPSHDLSIVGVTGTNGKTTVATLLYQILTMTGHKTALISTAETIIGTKHIKRDGAPTTPDSLSLQELLYQIKLSGCTHVCMEVSSHATTQHRTEGIRFSGGIFTNIGHDHLDYHKTFQNYLFAKQAFFEELPDTAFALANIDDNNGPFMLQNTKASTFYYGLDKKSDYDLDIMGTEISGSLIQINKKEFQINLPGAYNAYNAAAAYGAAALLGTNAGRVMSRLVPPPGRFEIIKHPSGVVGVVDYAHTPGALDSLLQTICDVTTDKQKLITVVGAGGDRDHSKRGAMGRISAEISDISIFTSDNPRKEEPLEIINDMKSSLYLLPESEVLVNPDREEAIKQAVSLANSGDVVAIVGKGHEEYQEVKGQKIPFSDKKIFLDSK